MERTTPSATPYLNFRFSCLCQCFLGGHGNESVDDWIQALDPL